jgi:Ca2+-binding EF-hand superfamily protein
MPIMTALDANADRELDATEIANASAALLTLDKNNDGKLSAEELRPPPPRGTNQFRGTPPQGAKHPVPPLLAALDANGDGELDATEIANASAALLLLDINGNGALTKEELCPKGHGNRGGPGGPPEGDGPGEPEGPDGPGQPPPQ